MQLEKPNCYNTNLNICKLTIFNWLVSIILFNSFPNKPWFLRVCSTSLLKTLQEKEKLLVTSNLSFSHSDFNPLAKLSAVLIKVKNCRLQTLSILTSLKFVVWERINMFFP